jgi:hypothetical protein
MAERGAAGQSERRHPAAHEIGIEPSYPGPLLLFGPVSLVARQRVVAGQPCAADRCSAKLFECQTQANRRPGGGSATVTSFPGADCACPARDGADAGARHGTGVGREFWAAYFAMFLLWESQSPEPRKVPVYSCDPRGHLAAMPDALPICGLTFADVIVDGRLSGEPFGLKEWPNVLRDLQVDVVLLKRDRKTAEFIEVKTIGESVKRNLERYPKVCETLQKSGWNAKLYYLLSHGHEKMEDFKLLVGKSRIILWEDVFRFVAGTPLGKMLVGVPLSSYATLPEPCNCKQL